jgi:hypothetical protein
VRSSRSARCRRPSGGSGTASTGGSASAPAGRCPAGGWRWECRGARC